MTKPTFPRTPTRNVRGRFTLKMWRTATNSAGKFGISLNSDGSSEVFIDVTKYSVSEWHQIDIFMDVSAISAELSFININMQESTGKMVGGAVWICDIRFIEEPIAQVSWQKTAGAAQTLVSNNVGEHIFISTGGVTIDPSSTLGWPIGGQVEIINNSGSSQTITQGGGVTLRLAGTATTGNRTLAQRGRARLIKVGTDEWICDGTGVT